VKRTCTRCLHVLVVEWHGKLCSLRGQSCHLQTLWKCGYLLQYAVNLQVHKVMPSICPSVLVVSVCSGNVDGISPHFQSHNDDIWHKDADLGLTLHALRGRFIPEIPYFDDFGGLKLTFL